MINLILPFLASFLITILTTPLTIKLAKKFGFVDDPSRSDHPANIHKRVVAKAGGIPIFISLVVSLFIFVPIDKHILGLIAGSLVLLIVGLIDDKKDLSPYPRLLVQFLAAALVVGSGVGIAFVTNPFGGILRLDQFIYPIEFFGSHNIVLIADLFAFVWIVWIMNMVNWSWGVDGGTPGIVTMAAMLVGFLAFEQFLLGDPNQLPLAMVSFIIAGTSLGFLIFNWHPAKIFPGDSGSNILGFLIAVLCILSSAKLAIALLVMLIPAMDFFYTFFRRLLKGRSPFKGDNRHLHHLLLKRGWSHPAISLFYISSCAILGILAASLPSEGKLFVTIGIGVLVIGLIVWLQRITGELEK